jgi:protein SCO1/2
MVEHTEPVPPTGRGGLALRRRDLAIIAGLLVALGVVLYVLIGAGAKQKGLAGTSVTSGHTSYAGLAETRPLPAPPLKLDNYLGTAVNLASYHGKAVFVTFLYTHCPNICPLIAAHLHTALTEMPVSERSKLAIIAVSVDPHGDTQSTVAQFLHTHEMTGRMQYLIGSAKALAATWNAWGITAGPQTGDPELVAHDALIYGITAHGKVAVVYPANFTPGEIVHDVPLLASA